MSVSINNNIPSLTAQRFLGTNNSKTQKAMNRLSCGLKINSAADDAASLAISEKMRGQIRGLNMARKNAQEGASLVQTADGGMDEIHSILHRMKELAVYACNELVLTVDDRQNIQDEVDQLKKEIDDIAERTEFNTIKVLSGKMPPRAQKAPATGSLPPLPNDGVVRTLGRDFMRPYGDRYSPELTTSVGDEMNVTYAQHSSPTYGRVYDAAGGGYHTFSLWGTAPDAAANPNRLSHTTAAFVSGGMSPDGDIFQAVYNVAGTYSDGSAFNFDVLQTIAIVRNRFAGESYEYNQQIVNNGASALNVGLNVSIDAQSGGSNINANSVYVNGDLTVGRTAGVWPRSTLNGGPQIGYDPSGGSTVQTNIDIFAGGDGPDVFMMKQSFAPFSDDNTPSTGSSQSEFSVEWTSRTVAAGAASANMIFQYGVGSLGYDPSWDSNAPAVVPYEDDYLWLQTGANTTQGFYVKLPNMHTRRIGFRIDQPNVVDIDTEAEAVRILDLIDSVVANVSHERARMGAVYNRLEFTDNYVANESENLAGAESRLRDTDMAREMSNYTKENIKAQAGQSMLAQSNARAQNVLSLLR